MPPKPPAVLNKPARDALQGHLDRLLSKLTIMGTWPDFEHYPEVQAFHEALLAHDRWRSHLTTWDLFELIAGVVKRFNVNVEGASQKLTALLDSERLKAFNVAVRDHLLSIPRQYKLWIALPAMPLWGVGSIRLSPRAELVEIQRKRKTRIDLVAEALLHQKGRGLLDPPLKVGETSVYLVVDATGWAAGRVETTAVTDGISHVKQFFQMFRRTEAYDRDWASQTLGGEQIESWIVDVQYPEHPMSITLPPALSKFLAAATIAEGKLTVPTHSGAGIGLALLIPDGSKVAETREEKESALRTKIGWVTRLMNAPDSEDANRIRSACEWAFDAEQNENQTLAFLQACIGLEALLGDSSEDEPLVARLKDRCAYLLGGSHADRESIRKRFATMYNVRSKVVHGRSPRLSLSDAKQLHYAQSLLGDVLSEEANRLLKRLKD